MAAGAARSGKAYIELGVRSKLSAGLLAASRRIDQFGARVRRAGAAVAGIGAAATGGLLLAAKSFASTGARVRDMSIRLGIGAETLSRIDYAAKQAGTSFEGVAKGIGRLARVTSDAGRGLETYQRTFRDLGIDLDQFQTLSLEEQFLTAGDALSKITDESKRAAIAQELFGRAGLELIPIFEDGAESVRAFFAEADRLGVTISDEEAKQAKALDDAFTRVTETLKRVSAAIGEALAPDLERLANIVADNIASIRAFLKANSGAIVTVAKVAAGAIAAGVAITGLGYAFSGVALAIQGAMLLLNPFTLALGGVLAAVTVFGTESRSALAGIGSDFKAIGEDAKSTIDDIKDAIANGRFDVAGQIAMAGLELAFVRGLGSIRQVWDGWIDDLASGLITLETEIARVFRNSDSAIGTLLAGVGQATGNQFLINQGFDLAQRGGVFDPGLDENRDSRLEVLEKMRESRETRLARRIQELTDTMDDLRREASRPLPQADAPEDPTDRRMVADPDSLATEIGTAVAAATTRTENLRTLTRGTFSSFAAGRINSAMDQVQREQLTQLKAIAQNTQNPTGQVYTP